MSLPSNGFREVVTPICVWTLSYLFIEADLLNSSVENTSRSAWVSSRKPKEQMYMVSGVVRQLLGFLKSLFYVVAIRTECPLDSHKEPLANLPQEGKFSGLGAQQFPGVKVTVMAEVRAGFQNKTKQTPKNRKYRNLSKTQKSLNFKVVRYQFLKKTESHSRFLSVFSLPSFSQRGPRLWDRNACDNHQQEIISNTGISWLIQFLILLTPGCLCIEKWLYNYTWLWQQKEIVRT